MKQRKVIIVGDCTSVFVNKTAIDFIEYGWRVEIISRYKKCETEIATTKTKDYETKLTRVFILILSHSLNLLEILYRKFAVNNNREAYPSMANSVIEALSIRNYILRKQPDVDLIYVHQAFNWILVGKFLKKFKTIIYPWGGDVYEYAHEHTLAFKMVKAGLHNFDFINVYSRSVKDYIINTYEIRPEKIIVTVDTFVGQQELFKVKNHYSKATLKREIGIDSSSKVLINLRRFKEKWGSKECIKVFLDLLKTRNDIICIIIGGDGAGEDIKQAKNLVRKNNMERNFLFFDKTDIETYAKLVYVSDISFSLMHSGDMRSASILMALAAETVPILSKQDEYFKMLDEGMNAFLFDYISHDNIVKKTNEILNSRRNSNIIQSNLDYINANYHPTKYLHEIIEQIK